MQEVWLPVTGWEGLYEVSNLGRVRSFDQMLKHGRGGLRILRGRIMKFRKNKKGYLCGGFRKNGIEVKFLAHRLVAQHFLPPSDLPEVNHNDSNRAHNAARNLEWVTRQENMDHAKLAGAFDPVKYPRRAPKLSAETIPKIRAARLDKKTYKAIAAEFDICQMHAWNIVNNKRWRTA